MFDYFSTNNTPARRGALEIELQAREQGKKMSLLTAEYKKEGFGTHMQKTNPFLHVLAILLGLF